MMKEATLHSIRRPMALATACALMALGLAGQASAQLQVEISGAGANQYPIAVADFSDTNAAQGRQLSDVVRADLTRSGLFRMINARDAGLDINSEIGFAAWQSRGANALVYGTAQSTGDQLQLSYRLVDTMQESQLDGMAFTTPVSHWRKAAHQVSDRICEKLSGSKCAFSTRIAYVVKRGSTWELVIADADGHNPQTALRSRESIISPAWSPDGSRLAYVSFESGKPVVYVHTIASGERVPVANFKGNNSAPAWSPDGGRLAVVLSRDGSSQIYIINADGSGVRRLTEAATINTEPSFSPDGRYVVFSSDRGGAPQIYRVGVDGGQPERLTFNGNYNVSPSMSPDGSTLLYVTRRGSNYQVAALNLSSGNESLLTQGPDDQSPTFSPDGGMVLYTSGQRGGVLAVVSVDGQARETLATAGAGVRTSAWGPFGTAK
jgi:TolB protein